MSFHHLKPAVFRGEAIIREDPVSGVVSLTIGEDAQSTEYFRRNVMPILHRVSEIHGSWSMAQGDRMPSLEIIDGHFHVYGGPDGRPPVDLPALRQINGVAKLYGPIHAPLLRTVDHNVDINTSLFLPALERINGTLKLVVSANDPERSIELPALIGIVGDLTVFRATSLEPISTDGISHHRFSMDRLRAIGGNLRTSLLRHDFMPQRPIGLESNLGRSFERVFSRWQEHFLITDAARFAAGSALEPQELDAGLGYGLSL